MTARWTDPDVEYTRQLASNLEADDPTIEHYTTDDPDALLWAGVLACIICAIVACGLALIVVSAARHWVGLAQLLLAAGLLTLAAWAFDELVSAVSRVARNWRWPL